MLQKLWGGGMKAAWTDLEKEGGSHLARAAGGAAVGAGLGAGVNIVTGLAGLPLSYATGGAIRDDLSLASVTKSAMLGAAAGATMGGFAVKHIGDLAASANKGTMRDWAGRMAESVGALTNKRGVTTGENWLMKTMEKEGMSGKASIPFQPAQQPQRIYSNPPRGGNDLVSLKPATPAIEAVPGVEANPFYSAVQRGSMSSKQRATQAANQAKGASVQYSGPTLTGNVSAAFQSLYQGANPGKYVAGAGAVGIGFATFGSSALGLGVPSNYGYR